LGHGIGLFPSPEAPNIFDLSRKLFHFFELNRRGRRDRRGMLAILGGLGVLGVLGD